MFKKAERKRRMARIALLGPTGSGKTYSALQIAKGLADGRKVALIDTENHSSELYADVMDFDVCQLSRFSPRDYIDAIEGAAQAGYGVLVIDSLSHAWMGKGGTLEQVDKKAAASKSGSSFEAWRHVTPEHNSLVDALVRAPLHLVVTMRTKMEYIIEKDSKGHSVPRKVGMSPVQRDGLEYEFDVVGDMDDATLRVSKSRCSWLADENLVNRPTSKLGERILEWLQSGAEPSAEEPPKSPLQSFALKCAAELAELGVTDAIVELRKRALVIAGTREGVNIAAINQARDQIAAERSALIEAETEEVEGQ